MAAFLRARALRTGSSWLNLFPRRTRWRWPIWLQADAIIRYGETIGYAKRAIARGSWVHEGLMDMPDAPPLDDCPLATATPAPLPPLEGYTFEGYRNADGSVGTKNILGITTTVQCVAPTVDYAVQRIKAEMLPRYPNVDDVIAITHPYGCGVAIDAPGAADSDSHAAQSGAESELRRRADGGEPGMREAAAGATDACERACRCSTKSLTCVRCRMQHHGFGEMVAAIMALAEKKLRRAEPAAARDVSGVAIWSSGCSAAAATRSRE